MFDFGFSEILVIVVLALIVLGPERLPGVVRKVGRWVGRARAMARQLQEQLEEEIDLDGARARSAPPPLPPDPPVYTEPLEPAKSEAASGASSHESATDAAPGASSHGPMTDTAEAATPTTPDANERRA
jgi:sec-independent protein translocase protein TatB